MKINWTVGWLKVNITVQCKENHRLTKSEELPDQHSKRPTDNTHTHVYTLTCRNDMTHKQSVKYNQVTSDTAAGSRDPDHAPFLDFYFVHFGEIVYMHLYPKFEVQKPKYLTIVFTFTC